MSISDAFILIKNYSENLDDFIEELINTNSKKRILKRLETGTMFAKASIVGTKKGNDEYNNWKRELINEYEDLKRTKELTVFEKLKKGLSKKKTNTVFDKLKRIRHGI